MCQRIQYDTIFGNLKFIKRIFYYLYIYIKKKKKFILLLKYIFLLIYKIIMIKFVVDNRKFFL